MQLRVQGGQVVDVGVRPPELFEEEARQRQLHQDACGGGWVGAGWQGRLLAVQGQWAAGEFGE